MNARLLLILAVLFARCLPAADNSTATSESGFVPLFNGRDLNGWVNVNCAPETWSVTNGVIHCTGKPTGALRTERQYENFILELEWRHLRAGGNAGIFLWASAISAPGVPFLRAIEVQVLDHGYGKSDSFTTHGDVFPIHGSTMKPHGRNRGMRSFPSEERSKGAPEWNHYRIVCTNGVLRLSVNGKEVSGGSDCNYRKGYLALESEGSPVEFRNLRLKELPSTGAPADMTAPLDQGWLPLYTGLDHRGWTVSAGNEKRWQIADWRLVLREGNNPDVSLTWTQNKYRDFEFIVDFQLPEKADLGLAQFGICVRGSDRPVVVIGQNDAPVMLDGAKIKPRQWHRLLLRVQGRILSAQLNGSPVAENVPLPENIPAQGSIGVADFLRPLEFANFYVRQL